MLEKPVVPMEERVAREHSVAGARLARQPAANVVKTVDTAILETAVSYTSVY